MNTPSGPAPVPDREEATEIVAAITEVMIRDASTAVRELVTGFEVLVERLMLARKFSEGLDDQVDGILAESVDRALECVVAMQFYDRLEQRLRQMQKVAGCLAAGPEPETWKDLVQQLRSLYCLKEDSPLLGAVSRFLAEDSPEPPEAPPEVDFELF